jgi:hypothetical protein
MQDASSEYLLIITFFRYITLSATHLALLIVCVYLYVTDMRKKGGFSLNFIKSYKAIVLTICAIFSVDVIVHYLVLAEKLLVISFILLETLKYICFFLACQYYCKAALGFLPTKHKWLLLLRILILGGFSIMLLGGIFLILNGILVDKPDMLCHQPLFLVLRAGGEIVIYFFLVVGIVLTK